MTPPLHDLAQYCLGLWATSAWLTHWGACYQAEQWDFMITGALVFPIGIMHGTCLWLGVW